jgi:hypothetical protein
MLIASRLFRYIALGLLMTAIGIGATFMMLPKGTKVQDIPKVLADYRQQTHNPTAQKLIEMVLSDEQLALSGEGGSGSAAIAMGNGIGDQVELGHTALVTTAGTAYDPSALEGIKAMNISNELKQEIMRHYLRTGQLPGVQIAASSGQPNQGDGRGREGTRQPDRQPTSMRADPQPTTVRTLSAAVKATLAAANTSLPPSLEMSAAVDGSYQRAYARLVETLAEPQPQQGPFETAPSPHQVR